MSQSETPQLRLPLGVWIKCLYTFFFLKGNCGLQMLLIDIWICMPIASTSVFSRENYFTMSGFLLWIYEQLCQCFTRRAEGQNQMQCFENWGRWPWCLHFEARWVTWDKIFPLFVLNISVPYVKPIALKFKSNPEIPILYVASIMSTNFQTKILSPKNCKNTTLLWMDFRNSFTCLTGMIKLTFFLNFSNSGHF